MKVLLIQNPAAGSKKGGRPLRALMKTFRRAGADVTLVKTHAQGDGEALAREADDAFALIACAGGDGTLREVISGVLARTGRRPSLGFIPFGTANDVAYSLGLPRRPQGAGAILLHGPRAPMDVGRFNGDCFVYTASFGTFSDVAYLTPQTKKRRFGKLAYVLTGVAQLGRLRTHRATIRHDGGEETAEWALVALTNARRVGGGFIRYRADEARLDDGRFELMMVKAPTCFAHMIWVLLKMALRVPDARYLQCVRTSAAHITADTPIPWCLDGENGGAWTRAEIEVIPRCIEVVFGKGALAAPKERDPLAKPQGDQWASGDRV